MGLVFGSQTPEWIDRIRMRCLGSVQQCLNLYLASLDRDSGYTEAGRIRNVDGIHFGSIEPFVHSRKRASQCPMDCSFCRSA